MIIANANIIGRKSPGIKFPTQGLMWSSVTHDPYKVASGVSVDYDSVNSDYGQLSTPITFTGDWKFSFRAGVQGATVTGGTLTRFRVNFDSVNVSIRCGVSNYAYLPHGGVGSINKIIRVECIKATNTYKLYIDDVFVTQSSGNGSYENPTFDYISRSGGSYFSNSLFNIEFDGDNLPNPIKFSSLNATENYWYSSNFKDDGYFITLYGAVRSFSSENGDQYYLTGWNKYTNLISDSTNLTGWSVSNCILAPGVLSENTISGRHIVFTKNPVTTGVYEVSVILEQNQGARFAFFQIALNGAVNRYGIILDLSTGQITDTNSLGVVENQSHSISDLGGGRYKATLTLKSQPTGSADAYFVLGMSDSGTPTYNASKEPIYQGDGTSSILFGNPQMNQVGNSAGHIATTGTAINTPQLITGFTPSSTTDIFGNTILRNWIKNAYNSTDRVGDYAQIEDVANSVVDTGSAYTVCFWIYRTKNADGFQALMGNGRLFFYLLPPSNDIRIFTNTVNAVHPGISIPNNEWAFYAITVSDTAIVNVWKGDANNTPSIAGTSNMDAVSILPGNKQMYVGNQNQPNYPADSILPDIAFFEGVLDESVINQCWQSTKSNKS